MIIIGGVLLYYSLVPPPPPSYHPVVQNAIRYSLPGVVLGVQSLAHHVDVRLLPHLLRGEQPKLQVATGTSNRQSTQPHKHGFNSLKGIFVRSKSLFYQGYLLKRFTYIFLATSVSLNCSFMVQGDLGCSTRDNACALFARCALIRERFARVWCAFIRNGFLASDTATRLALCRG